MNLSLAIPQTLPQIIAITIGALAVIYAVCWLVFRLVRFLSRAWNSMLASWKVEDEKHFREVFREHQKSHEQDGRSY